MPIEIIELPKKLSYSHSSWLIISLSSLAFCLIVGLIVALIFIFRPTSSPVTSVELESNSAFESAIANSKDPVEIAQLRIKYSRFLLSEELYDDILPQLDQVDPSLLETGDKMGLYATYRDYYKHANNVEQFLLYNDRILEAMKGTEYEKGGS